MYRPTFAVGRQTLRFVAPALLAVAFAGARAQDSTKVPLLRVYHGRIIGVYDDATGEPIEGVEVRDIFTGLSALTTATGTVSLFFVDTTGGVISFRKVGYQPLTMPIANSLADTTPVALTLTRVGAVLATVVTSDSSPHYRSPGLQGFEERRRNGMGQYISEVELRRQEGEPLADVLGPHLSGATIANGFLMSTRKSCNGPALRQSACVVGCFVTVYTDGIVTYTYQTGPGAALPPDFHRISADDYAGIEYYATAATMPAWISPTNNDCGVLLLWTRER